jgi:hypothetical protein
MRRLFDQLELASSFGWSLPMFRNSLARALAAETEAMQKLTHVAAPLGASAREMLGSTRRTP